MYILLKTPCGVHTAAPEFWRVVTWRLARFFDQQNSVRRVVVCGSWRFLAVLAAAWALAAQKREAKNDKTYAWVTKSGAQNRWK